MESRTVGEQPVPPAAPGAGDDRHRRAVAQSLAWAQAAAEAGDVRDALGWIETVRSVDGRLPADWEERRRLWQLALASEQATVD